MAFLLLKLSLKLYGTIRCDRFSIGYVAVDEIKIIYKLEYEKPIRLAHFAEALNSVDQQYMRFLRRHRKQIADHKIRLHIQEVRKGSIEAILVPLFSYAITYPSDVQSIIDYVKTFGELMGFFQGVLPKPPFHIEKADIVQAKNAVRPVAHDNAAQLNLCVSDNANVNVNINITPPAATTIMENANRHLRQLEEPQNSLLEDQLLFFRSTEDIEGTSKTDKGIIERISQEPVHVSATGEMKKLILEAPYKYMYLVDVDVQTVEGKPSLYIIKKLKEVIPRDASN